MIDLILGILATWRLTKLLYAGNPPESGPYEILDRFRDFAGVRYDEHSNPVSDTQVGKALTCFLCTSVWAGLFISIFQGKSSFVRALAYSAGAILFRDVRGRLQ